MEKVSAATRGQQTWPGKIGGEWKNFALSVGFPLGSLSRVGQVAFALPRRKVSTMTNTFN